MPDLSSYFGDLEREHGITVTDGQKAWYTKKWDTLREGMKTQYPSTLAECWEVANSGLWYGKAIENLYTSGRIRNVPIDRSLPVNTAWDLGRRDPTAIWFFQLRHGEVLLVDYYENNFESISHYVKVLQDKSYLYGSHFVPHDAGIKSFQTGKSLIDYAKELGISLTMLSREQDILPATNYVRTLLERCLFDETKCRKGLLALQAYRKEWSEKNNCFVERELHDWASHGSSAFRYLGRAVQILEGRGVDEKVTSHLERLHQKRISPV